GEHVSNRSLRIEPEPILQDGVRREPVQACCHLRLKLVGHCRLHRAQIWQTHELSRLGRRAVDLNRHFHLARAPVMPASLRSADCLRAVTAYVVSPHVNCRTRAQDFGLSAPPAFPKLARSSAMLATILSLAILSASACDLLTWSAICFVWSIAASNALRAISP